MLDNLSAGQVEPDLPDGVRFVRGDYTEREDACRLFARRRRSRSSRRAVGRDRFGRGSFPKFPDQCGRLISAFGASTTGESEEADQRFDRRCATWAKSRRRFPRIWHLHRCPLMAHRSSRSKVIAQPLLALMDYPVRRCDSPIFMVRTRHIRRAWSRPSSRTSFVASRWWYTAMEPSSATTSMSATWWSVLKRRLKRELTGAYQLGSGKPTALTSLIETLKEVSGRHFEVRHEARRSGEVHATWCNIGKASREFGYSAPTDLKMGVRSTWTWYVENQDRWSRQLVLSAAD